MEKPTPPITPASVPSYQSTHAIPKAYATAFVVIMVTMTIGMAWAMFIFNETIGFMREEIAEQKDAVDTLVDTMTPPTNDKMFATLSRGLGITEDNEYRTDTVGTTPKAAFAIDLTTAQQTDAFTQEALIQNTDAHVPAQNLCVKPIAWSTPGASCTAKCAGSTITCSAAATDGWRISGGGGMEFRWDGTVCACVVGSAASTAYQSRRATR